MGGAEGGVFAGQAAAGPAAEPPTRAKPVCFDAVETACGRMPAVCKNFGGYFLRVLELGKACKGAFGDRLFLRDGGAGEHEEAPVGALGAGGYCCRM